MAAKTISIKQRGNVAAAKINGVKMVNMKSGSGRRRQQILARASARRRRHHGMACWRAGGAQWRCISSALRKIASSIAALSWQQQATRNAEM